jgi:hypothetical protein
MESRGRVGAGRGSIGANCSTMKIYIAIFLVVVLTAQTASAQFAGTLVYRDVRSNIVLTMVYAQSGTNGFMAANNMNIAGGKVDSTSMKAQDTIIWDFNAQTETHYQQATKNAYIQPYFKTMTAMAMANRQITCKAVGTAGGDTANGYTCSHYQVTIAYGRYSETRDLWIASSVPAPTVYVCGDYNYATPGSKMLNAIVNAGGTGLVVREITMIMGRPGARIELIKYEAVNPRRLRFTMPSYYTPVNQTNLTAQ